MAEAHRATEVRLARSRGMTVLRWTQAVPVVDKCRTTAREDAVRVLQILTGRRTSGDPRAPERVVFRCAPARDITLVVRIEAAAFFLVLALSLDLLIMPWALDTHPLVHVRNAWGHFHTMHMIRHAGTLTRYFWTVVTVLVIAAATLAHEMGHALALRRAGAKEITITVYGAGGACRAQAQDTTPLALLWYASAGPLVTIAIVIGLIVGRMILPLSHQAHAVLWLCAAIEVGILALNLLPIFKKSDGGHMLRAWGALMPTVRWATVVGGVALSLITAVLVGTLQGAIPSALLCCAVTVLLIALTARVARRADQRLGPRPKRTRPETAERAITVW
jgi:Zn-dependent protease